MFLDESESSREYSDTSMSLQLRALLSGSVYDSDY